MKDQSHTTHTPQDNRALRLIPGPEMEMSEHTSSEPAPVPIRHGRRTILVEALIFAAIAGFAAIFATGQLRFTEFAKAFPVDVLAILLALDIFSRLVAQTGALDAIGAKLTRATRGRSALAAMLMGLLMFGASAVLNNLAAIFVLAPIFLALLHAMQAPERITLMFVSLMLVLCNLGGMATPMGDFPAILLMSSGLVGFTPYLVGAFPLALSLALIAIMAYSILLQHEQAKNWTHEEDARTRIHLSLMDVRNRHSSPDFLRVILLSSVFAAMVVAWALVSPDVWPFFMTAVVGVAAAAVLNGPKRTGEVITQYNLKTLAWMMVILTFAAVVSAIGIVAAIANVLVAWIPNDTALLIALMSLVTVAAGLFSAGPATAAVLPIFISLSNGPLSSLGDLIGVAFAASICAGSSMFMHSATAGPALRGEVDKAGFVDNEGHVVWDFRRYLRFGLITAMCQIALSITWVLLAATFEQPWWLNLVPLVLFLILSAMIIRQYRQGANTIVASPEP